MYFTKYISLYVASCYTHKRSYLACGTAVHLYIPFFPSSARVNEWGKGWSPQDLFRKQLAWAQAQELPPRLIGVSLPLDVFHYDLRLLCDN